jgi:transcriptional regulator with XRE-family HTH domain
MEKEIDFSLIGRRIREVRQKTGMSQASLADLAGCNDSYISNIERGDKQVSLTALVAVADALEVTADVLLFGNQRFDTKAYHSEFVQVLSDCSEFEKRIIFNAACAVKKSIKDEYMLKRNHDAAKKPKE